MIWEQIRSNQRRSVGLVFGIGAILLVLGYFIGLYFGSPVIGLIIASLIWMIMSLVAYFQGDSILLSMSKAKKIRREDHPRLYNVVEEMQLATGLPKMPDIYIIDDPALNAFATGRDPNKASVAITSGLLAKLNRDELQGVIAHEMSHIKNRDVLLMSMCGVLLGTIVFISYYASRMIFFGGASRNRRSSSSGDGGGIIIAVIAIVLMIIAPIAAQLIYFAISRRREYLADASGALYTRYPEGLASALEKISASTQELRTANKATAPMFIINPFRKEGRAATDLTSTHPPISERIRILRTMAGASYKDYEQSYEQVHGGRHVVPASALTQAETVAIRAPGTEPVEEVQDRIQRTRETSDALWQTSGYKNIDCPCGLRLKVPPSLQHSSVQCPRCGRIHAT